MINIAVLGTNFGKFHAKLFSRIKGAAVKTVYGRNTEKLAEIQNQLEVNTTTDLEDVLNNRSIDLVDICLPSELHRDFAIRCLDAKKHVFCETPLAFSCQDAADMLNAAKRNNRNVFVDQFLKFSQPHKFAIDFVRNESGKPPVVFSCYNKTAPVWGDLSVGKSLLNFYIYNMDFMIEIMGYPEEVAACALDQPEKSAIFGGYKYGDRIASVTCLSNLPENTPLQTGYQLIFEDRILSFSGSYGEKIEESVQVMEGPETRLVSLPGVDPYEGTFRHVIDCMSRNEKSNLIDIETAMLSIRLIEETKIQIYKR
ncbi:MAG: Gfo/Idh/MocA family oxidoreductase [Anaerolineales bacterium]|nr:Gfo/Idh/MocA family oxidoreductase [Anaerolineales bacterium]